MGTYCCTGVGGILATGDWRLASEGADIGAVDGGALALPRVERCDRKSKVYAIFHRAMCMCSACGLGIL